MKVKFLFAVATLLLSWGSVQSPRPADDVELFKDDFSRFPPGVLSAPVGLLNGAIQEYHYIEHRGVPTRPVAQPDRAPRLVGRGRRGRRPVPGAAHRQPRTGARHSAVRDRRSGVARLPRRGVGQAALVGEGGGAGGALPHVPPLLPAGARGGHAVAAGRQAAVRRAVPRGGLARGGGAPFPYDTKTWYRLEAAVEGDRLRASVDGRPLIDVRDRELAEGIAGLTANRPARFRSFRVTATRHRSRRSAPARGAPGSRSRPFAGREPTAKGVAEVRHAGLRCRAQRTLR